MQVCLRNTKSHISWGSLRFTFRLMFAGLSQRFMQQTKQVLLFLCLLLQVMNGLMQTTGWPSVVACVGNWFGKGK